MLIKSSVFILYSFKMSEEVEEDQFFDAVESLDSEINTDADKPIEPVEKRWDLMMV